MKISNSNDFGMVVRKKRKAMGLTQIALAEFTGLSASFISNLENGKETCELEKALYVVNILGINIEFTERG